MFYFVKCYHSKTDNGAIIQIIEIQKNFNEKDIFHEQAEYFMY